MHPFNERLTPGQQDIHQFVCNIWKIQVQNIYDSDIKRYMKDFQDHFVVDIE